LGWGSESGWKLLLLADRPLQTGHELPQPSLIENREWPGLHFPVFIGPVSSAGAGAAVADRRAANLDCGPANIAEHTAIRYLRKLRLRPCQ